MSVLFYHFSNDDIPIDGFLTPSNKYADYEKGTEKRVYLTNDPKRWVSSGRFLYTVKLDEFFYSPGNSQIDEGHKPGIKTTKPIKSTPDYWSISPVKILKKIQVKADFRQ